MDNVEIRIPASLIVTIKADLKRKHSFAYERAGFAFGRSTKLNDGTWLVIINDYQPIPDEYYIRTNEVGARINSKAITRAFQKGYSDKLGIFHIHEHGFTTGIPGFSPDDLESLPKIVKSASDFIPDQVHGMVVLSENLLNADVKVVGVDDLQTVNKISSVGSAMKFGFPSKRLKVSKNVRFSRQSFLGIHSEDLISRLKIGVVGLSGGGSHVVQQLAHIGFQNYTLSDPDIIDDESNLNRVVGATLLDAMNKESKFNVSSRVIKNLHPKAFIDGKAQRWELLKEELKKCDVIFGCLDTEIARRDLENFCRRFLIPYIDIGMGIEQVPPPPIMFGQVQVSIPGRPCLRCNGFITDASLTKEANNYGHKTKRPQVVWSNGVLASTAVGIAMEMITCWTKSAEQSYYLSYEGNSHVLTDHLRKGYLPNVCTHYPVNESGPVIW